MSDIADMLGIANKAPIGNVASEEALKIMGEKTKIVKGGKKPKGMSREVFDLLGKDGLVPAIQGNVVAPNFKSKRVNALKGKWVWTPITSSAMARQNNQPAFFHWIKADQTYVDYPYASFNVKFDTFQYTDDEYEKYLSADPAWSRADTDQLVQVCHRFDMRWPVISDRIELSTPRAVESMQDRYYSVRAAIQAKRMEQASGAASAVQAPSSGFNVEQERKRRRAQDMLFKK
jgi:DNA methyltransferase 1-associated protein 1